jgi:hypothetical protein
MIYSLINDGQSFTAANITALVEQKMKTDFPLYFKKVGDEIKKIAVKDRVKVTKLQSGVIMLNGNYTNAVINEQIREGKEGIFQAVENWHTKLLDTFNGSIVAKKSDMSCRYLLCRIEAKMNVEKYYINGIETNDKETALIKEYKQISELPKNQGTEKPIIIRTFNIDGIKRIKCGQTVIFE